MNDFSLVTLADMFFVLKYLKDGDPRFNLMTVNLICCTPRRMSNRMHIAKRQTCCWCGTAEPEIEQPRYSGTREGQVEEEGFWIACQNSDKSA